MTEANAATPTGTVVDNAFSIPNGIGRRTRLLRLALKLDAVASGAFGVLSLAAGPLLQNLLGTPFALLWAVGLFLMAFAASIWIVASRADVSATAVWTVIAINLLWVVASVAAVAGGWFPLTGLGIAFVLAQAAAVAMFADLQFLGLRRGRPAVG